MEFCRSHLHLFQYNWLLRDLKAANANRAAQPWIVVVGHRPMYCSNNDGSSIHHCKNVNNIIRTGIPIPESSTFMFGLEKLFYDQGVDVIFAAHEHSYERMWPVYNRKVSHTSERELPSCKVNRKYKSVVFSWCL